jgi:hypothetical protein
MTDRRILPQRRANETFEIVHERIRFAVTVGHYDSGEPGEVFISCAKGGSAMDAVARDGAVLLSLAIQHGVPLTTIKNAITRKSNGNADTILGRVVDSLIMRIVVKVGTEQPVSTEQIAPCDDAEFGMTP